LLLCNTQLLSYLDWRLYAFQGFFLTQRSLWLKSNLIFDSKTHEGWAIKEFYVNLGLGRKV
ncbi:hypothetical protein NXZ77_20885, partial [Lysinibacillus boronitolerans]|uniref:hypothetical protein n=1 Tax=Lysinibacillus boronitolerans TaxID=309788 RepID=UPI002162B952